MKQHGSCRLAATFADVATVMSRAALRRSRAALFRRATARPCGYGLGHERLETTHQYVEADLQLKERALRIYLWRQWQSGRHRFRELRRRGVSQFPAAVAAGSPTGFWQMSSHPAVQQALHNRYFDSVGLPRVAGSSHA